MSIPYRTKRRMQNFGIFLLVLVLALILLWIIWFLWLDRYVVYTRDGARLDFSLSPEVPSGIVAAPPDSLPTIPIYYNDGEQQVQQSQELSKLYGFYADAGMLRKEMDTVRERISQLPPETPVMLDVKDISGRFYYSTALGVETDPNMDTDAVDELIAMLEQQNLYAIARVPAFRDRLYGLAHVPDGIYHSSRGYLWMDEARCYWLNPTKDGPLVYLMEIVAELKALGFDEVVFDDFRIPDTDAIYFDADKQEALQSAAAQLAAACTTKTFAVSFLSEAGAIALPEGRTRLYVEGMDAADAAVFAESMALETPESRLVFLTDSRDTRFQVFSLLRPINSEIMDIPDPTEP